MPSLRQASAVGGYLSEQEITWRVSEMGVLWHGVFLKSAQCRAKMMPHFSLPSAFPFSVVCVCLVPWTGSDSQSPIRKLTLITTPRENSSLIFCWLGQFSTSLVSSVSKGSVLPKGSSKGRELVQNKQQELERSVWVPEGRSHPFQCQGAAAGCSPYHRASSSRPAWWRRNCQKKTIFSTKIWRSKNCTVSGPISYFLGSPTGSGQQGAHFVPTQSSWLRAPTAESITSVSSWWRCCPLEWMLFLRKCTSLQGALT